MNVIQKDQRICVLGEGPLWHPKAQRLFWFDIVGQKLLSDADRGRNEWSFDRMVSAAGWLNEHKLLIADEFGLFTWDMITADQTRLVDIEKDNPITRSNDGRADPFGGFWIGTMGKEAEPEAGAIYRFFKGEVRQLFDHITIPNAICFSPDRRFAYFADTAQHKIFRQTLDENEGWPIGSAEVFADFSDKKLSPDGAVIDETGHIWCAFWGSACVNVFTPDGTLSRTIDMPASQVTCPAFFGPLLERVAVTSAAINDGGAEAGMLFSLAPGVRGLAEPQILLE